VRLGSELFQRAVHLLGYRERLTVWDPCCGSGQLVTTIGLLHRKLVRRLVATDIDPAVLPLARTNLSLLTSDGLAAKRAEIARLSERFGKQSHERALAAADRMRAGAQAGKPVEESVRCADIFNAPALAQAVEGISVDIVITDLPYGRQTHLHGPAEGEPDIDALLANLTSLLPPRAVIVLVLAGRRMPASGHRALATIRAGSRVAGLYRGT
jgi:tRNA G10  N-methylase Trm11